MKNVHNAVSDALDEIGAHPGIQERVDVDGRRYLVNLTLGQKSMTVEVFETEQNELDYATVLDRVRFSERFQIRFMDALLAILSD